MSVRAALDLMISMQSRTVTILNPSTAVTATIRIAPSNYFRNMQSESEIVIEGREFVISKTDLDSQSYPQPKRGDRITDPELGVMILSEVREMFGIGAEIAGYRVRTQ